MKFRKPALSIPDLVQRWRDRGLGIVDPAEAELRTVAPGTSWGSRLRDLLTASPHIDPAAMGFPPGWDAEPFWNLTPTS